MENQVLQEDADINDDGINVTGMNYRTLIVEDYDKKLRSNPCLAHLKQSG